MFVLVCQVGSVADEMVIGKQEGCRFDTRPDIMRQAERERERETDGQAEKYWAVVLNVVKAVVIVI